MTPVTPNSCTSVVKATAEDFDAVCDISAQAFDDDPVLNWLVRQDHGRQAGIRFFFAKKAKLIYFPQNEVYLNEDRTGATMWLPPGGMSDIGFWGNMVYLASMIKIGKLAGFRRMLAVRSLMANKHPHDPHYYLFSIGVLPELRGRGIGSTMIEPMLARCDREGMPAYLENSREANLPFYRKHGFEVTEEVSLPKGGPPLWLMCRAAG